MISVYFDGILFFLTKCKQWKGIFKIGLKIKNTICPNINWSCIFIFQCKIVFL